MSFTFRGKRTVIFDSYSDLPSAAPDGFIAYVKDYCVLLRYWRQYADWIPYFLYNESDPTTLSKSVPTWLVAGDITDDDLTGNNLDNWPNRGTDGDFTASGSARPTRRVGEGPDGGDSIDFNGAADQMDQSTPRS